MPWLNSFDPLISEFRSTPPVHPLVFYYSLALLDILGNPVYLEIATIFQRGDAGSPQHSMKFPTIANFGDETNSNKIDILLLLLLYIFDIQFNFWDSKIGSRLFSIAKNGKFFEKKSRILLHFSLYLWTYLNWRKLFSFNYIYGFLTFITTPIYLMKYNNQK